MRRGTKGFTDRGPKMRQGAKGFTDRGPMMRQGAKGLIDRELRDVASDLGLRQAHDRGQLAHRETMFAPQCLSKA